MIHIGYDDPAKREAIAAYIREHGIRRTVAISADEFPLQDLDADHVAYNDVIRYRVFYRLLQQIDHQTLVVLNECLRTQNRYDLAVNCIRHFLTLTTHPLIFQRLPQIDTCEDFMILFDWDTRSRWKRQGFDPDLVRRESRVSVRRLPLAFEPIPIPTSARTRQKYAAARERLFRELGPRDPHTIPRNLYLIGGPDKLTWIEAQTRRPLFDAVQAFVARNRRLRGVLSYRDVERGQSYTCVELPHRFIDFADFLTRTGQCRIPVLAADLKVDRWYVQRYTDWAQRIHATYASLS